MHSTVAPGLCLTNARTSSGLATPCRHLPTTLAVQYLHADATTTTTPTAHDHTVDLALHRAEPRRPHCSSPHLLASDPQSPCLEPYLQRIRATVDHRHSTATSGRLQLAPGRPQPRPPWLQPPLAGRSWLLFGHSRPQQAAAGYSRPEQASTGYGRLRQAPALLRPPRTQVHRGCHDLATAMTEPSDAALDT